MDENKLSSTSVMEALLKTNRPPTEQERAIIQESMAPTNAKLKAIDAQISDQMALIEELKLQVEQAENKLHRLWEEEAAILETFADHDRIFSPFRNLPEDIVREICVASVRGEIPKLSHDRNPMPYVLAQTCSGMRHIALTTPRIWAAMTVDISSFPVVSNERVFAILAHRAIEWIGRAGGLALTLILVDSNYSYPPSNGSNSDPASILFDALFSYSTRWKEFEYTSRFRPFSTPMIRIASLTAADIPLLQSVSLYFGHPTSNFVFHDSGLLKVPTLRHLVLDNAVRSFTVNWAVLTSITLNGDTKTHIWGILQLTKCLIFCNIVVHSTDQHHTHEINLPFLKTLIVSEDKRNIDLSGAHSILEAITVQALEIFEISVDFVDLSLSAFLKRSPRIYKLSVTFFDKNKPLMESMEFLRHCPSLTILSLYAHIWCRGTRDADQFLRAFVEESNDGVLCPRLKHFTFWGYYIDFSLETLRVFLEGKQAGICAAQVIAPWQRIVIDIRSIKSAGKRLQILDIVSPQKAAGLDVSVHALESCTEP